VTFRGLQTLGGDELAVFLKTAKNSIPRRLMILISAPAFSKNEVSAPNCASLKNIFRKKFFLTD